MSLAIRFRGKRVAALFTKKRTQPDVRSQMSDHQTLLQTTIFTHFASVNRDVGVFRVLVVSELV